MEAPIQFNRQEEDRTLMSQILGSFTFFMTFYFTMRYDSVLLAILFLYFNLLNLQDCQDHMPNHFKERKWWLFGYEAIWLIVSFVAIPLTIIHMFG